MRKTNQGQKRDGEEENTNFPNEEWERDSYYRFLLKLRLVRGFYKQLFANKSEILDEIN